MRPGTRGVLRAFGKYETRGCHVYPSDPDNWCVSNVLTGVYKAVAEVQEYRDGVWRPYARGVAQR